MTAKNIMFQGTASSVGKSLIATAFCRIFKQDGYKVAPFKSQNMALNSYITVDGKEIGRAQAVQAEAAGIEPSVEMNPILIKPSSQSYAQVILEGKVYKNMSAVSYDEYKYFFMDTVLNCYNKLSTDNDIIVIEGAGSPAEINLRKRDIVNMEIAQKVNAPVILIGDIDKGGVFASIYGTIMLLNKKDRERIKGILINKFRGDVNILKPGLKTLEKLVNLPVLGVIPYFNLNIDDEDSVTERFNNKLSNIKEVDNNKINIGVIRLPYISNFSDFTALENQTNVNLFYFKKPLNFKPDLVIIPGTKSTIHDLKFIKNSKIDYWLKDYHKSGGIIMGICGGYQILGKKILDPYKVESDIVETDGLNFLNIVTTFNKNKITSKVNAEILKFKDFDFLFKGLSKIKLEGYEIHMGISKPNKDVIPFIKLNSRSNKSIEEIDGYIDFSGRVFGTYIHGIFDNKEFLNNFLKILENYKGIKNNTKNNFDYKLFKDFQYDELAKIVRENVNLKKIYEIIFNNS